MGLIPDNGAETPPPTNPQDEAIKRIEEKLGAIEKRLSDKWMLPVVLAILGAFLTFGNYLLQRSFLNSDIFKNESSKANANFKSQSTSAFYKSCYEKLDTINKNFQSYCIIGPSKEEHTLLFDQQIKLTALIDHQFPIDPKVRQTLQDYINFVAEKLIDFEGKTVSGADLKAAYAQSKALFDKAVTEINAAFVNPER